MGKAEAEMRGGASSLAFCVVALALVVVSDGVVEPQGTLPGEVVMLEEEANTAPHALSTAGLKNAMNSVPKGVLALAMQKPAAKPVVRKAAAAGTKAKAAVTAQRQPQRNVKVTKPTISSVHLPKLPKLPDIAHDFSVLPKIHPLHVKIKTSPAMAAMAQLLKAHHVALPGDHSTKVTRPKQVETQHTQASDSKSIAPVPAKQSDATKQLAAAVKEEKQHTISLTAKKEPLRKNSLGEVDGSNNSWQPFVDRVPKRVRADKKRTFLPPTQKAFRGGAAKTTPSLAPVNEVVKAVEDNKVQKKAGLSKDLRESIGHILDDNTINYSDDDSLMQPVKAPEGHDDDSVRWPFGPPAMRDELSLLQSSTGSDPEDIGDANDDETPTDDVEDVRDNITSENKQEHRQNMRGNHDDRDDDDLGDSQDDDDDEQAASQNRDEGQPLIDYDPVKDMLKANGWSPDVLQHHAAAPNALRRRTRDEDHDEDDDDEDDEDEGEEGDEDDEDDEDEENDERDDERDEHEEDEGDEST